MFFLLAFLADETHIIHYYIHTQRKCDAFTHAPASSHLRRMAGAGKSKIAVWEYIYIYRPMAWPRLWQITYIDLMSGECGHSRMHYILSDSVLCRITEWSRPSSVFAADAAHACNVAFGPPQQVSFCIVSFVVFCRCWVNFCAAKWPFALAPPLKCWVMEMFISQ